MAIDCILLLSGLTIQNINPLLLISYMKIKKDTTVKERWLIYIVVGFNEISSLLRTSIISIWIMYFELSGLQMANGFYGLVHTQHIYTQTVNKPSYTNSQSNLPKPAYLTLLSNFTMSIQVLHLCMAQQPISELSCIIFQVQKRITIEIHMSIHTSMCMAFPIFQNSMQQPIPELASIIHEVSLSSKYRKTMSWQIKFTITDFADNPSMDLFLFQNWISEKL